jgi:hypothetical protein
MEERAPRPVWTGRTGPLASRLCAGVMGIVNLTPDSFFDGGSHDDPEAGLAHARRLLQDGADVIDVGHAEDQDRKRDAAVPETDALLGNGDRKHIAQTGLFQILPDLDETVAVCVRFDDCKELRSGFQPAFDEPDILQKRGKTDHRVGSSQHEITPFQQKMIVQERAEKVNSLSPKHRKNVPVIIYRKNVNNLFKNTCNFYTLVLKWDTQYKI